MATPGFAWQAGRDMNALSPTAESSAYIDSFADFGDSMFTGGNVTNGFSIVSTIILTVGLIAGVYLWKKVK